VQRSTAASLPRAKNFLLGSEDERHAAQPVAQPDPQRHAAYGPHFILALRRPAVAGRLASTLDLRINMKYFTREWWSGGCENAEEVFREYEAYVATVREFLPANLVELEVSHTLHDSEVKTVSVDLGLRYVAMVLHGWDAALQNKVRYTLRFAGATEFEQVFPQQEFVESELGDLGYWECELLDSCVEVRMLFVSDAEFRIRFTEFSFEHSRYEV